MLQRHDKGASVYHDERESNAQRDKWRGEDKGEVEREKRDKNKRDAARPRKIDELLYRKGSEDFVLDLDKLRNLVAHAY